MPLSVEPWKVSVCSPSSRVAGNVPVQVATPSASAVTVSRRVGVEYTTTAMSASFGSKPEAVTVADSPACSAASVFSSRSMPLVAGGVDGISRASSSEADAVATVPVDPLGADAAAPIVKVTGLRPPVRA